MTGGGGPVPHAADQSEKRKPGRTQPTDWPALEAALDANAARIASLNVSVTLAAGKPPTSEELVLAAAAREGLASVVAALPPSALWGASGPAPLPPALRAGRTTDLAAGLGLLPFMSTRAAPAVVSTALGAAHPPPALPPARPRTVLVLAGPCGAGKTSVGSALAASSRCGPGTPFLDGDDYHSYEAKAGMSAGQPLTEEARSAWLGRVGTAAARAAGASPTGTVVLACSALAAHHRAALAAAMRAAPGTRTEAAFVLLLPPTPALEARLVARGGAHFMPPALLVSQLALVEEGGEPGLRGVVREDGSVEAVVAAAAAAFGL